MLAEVIAYLCCPVCQESLAGPGESLRCPRGHNFDQAKQGYVHLTAGPVAHSGDSARMVAARADFLAAGHYSFLAEALAGTLAGALTEAAPEALAEAPPEALNAQTLPKRLVLDVGAGTGYHLGRVLDAHPDTVGLAIDVSKPALRRAARAHPRAGAVLADAWQALPVIDHGAAVLLNVFAPRNGPEFARVLAPDGALLVATPAAEHLAELVAALELLRVDPAKEERVAASLTPWFVEQTSVVHERLLSLSHAEVATLVGMGPSAWHTAPEVLAGRVAALPEPCRVTARIRLSRYSQVASEMLARGSAGPHVESPD